MDANKKYITQLSARDLKEMAAAANIHPGIGIEIVRKQDGLEISVDRDQLSRWVKAIIQGKDI